jgi:hypothetical protein
MERKTEGRSIRVWKEGHDEDRLNAGVKVELMK